MDTNAVERKGSLTVSISSNAVALIIIATTTILIIVVVVLIAVMMAFDCHFTMM